MSCLRPCMLGPGAVTAGGEGEMAESEALLLSAPVRSTRVGSWSGLPSMRAISASRVARSSVSKGVSTSWDASVAEVELMFAIELWRSCEVGVVRGLRNL